MTKRITMAPKLISLELIVYLILCSTTSLPAPVTSLPVFSKTLSPAPTLTATTTAEIVKDLMDSTTRYLKLKEDYDAMLKRAEEPLAASERALQDIVDYEEATENQDSQDEDPSNAEGGSSRAPQRATTMLVDEMSGLLEHIRRGVLAVGKEKMNLMRLQQLLASSKRGPTSSFVRIGRGHGDSSRSSVKSFESQNQPQANLHRVLSDALAHTPSHTEGQKQLKAHLRKPVFDATHTPNRGHSKAFKLLVLQKENKGSKRASPRSFKATMSPQEIVSTLGQEYPKEESSPFSQQQLYLLGQKLHSKSESSPFSQQDLISALRQKYSRSYSSPLFRQTSFQPESYAGDDVANRERPTSEVETLKVLSKSGPRIVFDGSHNDETSRARFGSLVTEDSNYGFTADDEDYSDGVNYDAAAAVDADDVANLVHGLNHHGPIVLINDDGDNYHDVESDVDRDVPTAQSLIFTVVPGSVDESGHVDQTEGKGKFFRFTRSRLYPRSHFVRIGKRSAGAQDDVSAKGLDENSSGLNNGSDVTNNDVANTDVAKSSGNDVTRKGAGGSPNIAVTAKELENDVTRKGVSGSQHNVKAKDLPKESSHAVKGVTVNEKGKSQNEGKNDKSPSSSSASADSKSSSPSSLKSAKSTRQQTQNREKRYVRVGRLPLSAFLIRNSNEVRSVSQDDEMPLPGYRITKAGLMRAGKRANDVEDRL